MSRPVKAGKGKMVRKERRARERKGRKGRRVRKGRAREAKKAHMAKMAAKHPKATMAFCLPTMLLLNGASDISARFRHFARWRRWICRKLSNGPGSSKRRARIARNLLSWQ